MKKSIMSLTGIVFFMAGIVVQYQSSEAIFTLISKSGSTKEFVYWLESVTAVLSLCVPGICMLKKGSDKITGGWLQISITLVCFGCGIAFLFRGMHNIFIHIGDDSAMVTFNTMTFSAVIQCFIAAASSMPEKLKEDTGLDYFF